MVALVSLASPLSPRLTNFFHTCSRRARSSANDRKGSTLERVFMIAQPARPLALAAAAAAALLDAGRPATPASFGIWVQVFSSSTTFWPKLVKALDRAVLMRPSSALPAASRA